MTADEVRAEVLDAEQRIRPYIRETPLEYSHSLSAATGCQVWLKLENLQLTNSFKLRGAMNAILALDDAARERGIVTASSGNHGMAVAHALQQTGSKGTIYLPETAPPVKVRDLRAYGVEIVIGGDDCVKAEMAARGDAETQGLTFISPYNDPKVVGGQGTTGLEIERQADAADAVFAPVGGGGLIGGIAGYLKATSPRTQIFGCQPEASAVMYESIRAGRIIEMESLPTLSDGSAGGIEAGSITFDICRDYVDDFVLVSEEEIASALARILADHHILVEGAAVLSVASFLKTKERFAGERVVLVLSGARISLETLSEILRHA